MNLNDFGIGSIRIGKDITQLDNVIPFAQSVNKGPFLVFPDKKYYYIYTREVKITECPSIFVCNLLISINKKSTINKIILFVNDSSNQLEHFLDATYGTASKATSNIDGAAQNKHFFWKTGSNTSIYLFSSAQSYLFPEGCNKEITFHFFSDLEAVNDYSIYIKPNAE